MPRVPTYDGPQVRSAPLQGGMQTGISSPDAFGAAQARQLGAFAPGINALDDAMERAAYRDDVAKADATYVTLQNEYNTTALGWKKDRVGLKADGLIEDADKWWSEAETRYSAGLNDRQRQLLGQHASRLRTGALADIGGFQEAQKRDFSVKAATAFIQSKIDEAAADPKSAAAARLDIRAKVAELQTLYGWNSDMANQESKKFTTQMHVEAIQSLIAKGNPQEAKRYFDGAVKLGDFDETKANDLLADINNAAAQDKGRTFASGVANLPYGDQLAKASELSDPVERKAAEEHIESNFVKLSKAKKLQADDLAGRAELEYQKTGRSPLQLLSQLEKIDPGKAAGIMKVIKADQKARLADAQGKSIKTDWNVYAELRALSPEELKKVNMKAYVDKIAPAQLEQLFDLQDKLTKPDKAVQARSQEQQLSAFTRELQLKDEDLGQFQSAFGDAVNAHIKAKGKEPDYEETKKILLDLNSDQLVKRNILWDAKVKKYKLPQAPVDPAAPAAAPEGSWQPPAKMGTIHSIAGEDRKVLSARLRAAGKPVTEETLQKAYAEILKGR